MTNINPRFFVIYLLALAVLVVSCSLQEPAPEPEPDPEVTSASWEELERNTRATLMTAKALSREKWAEIRSFSADEWNQLGERLQQLKQRADALNETLKPEVARLMLEIEELRLEANTRLQQLAESSGERSGEARQKLEEIWQRIQEKTNEIQERLQRQD